MGFAGKLSGGKWEVAGVRRGRLAYGAAQERKRRTEVRDQISAARGRILQGMLSFFDM